MQLRAHTSMYWSTINEEIADLFQSCVPYQTICAFQEKEPAILMEVPNRPRKTLGIDLFLHNSKYYLYIADYYSKFPWVQIPSATCTKDVISALSFCFSVPGTEE